MILNITSSYLMGITTTYLYDKRVAVFRQLLFCMGCFDSAKETGRLMEQSGMSLEVFES